MSNNRGSVSQNNHHSGQFRGSQSQGHHSSKPFLGIKGGTPLRQKKVNNSLVSIPRRISQRTKCHQNEGKRVTIDSSLIPCLRAKVNSFKGGRYPCIYTNGRLKQLMLLFSRLFQVNVLSSSPNRLTRWHTHKTPYQETTWVWLMRKYLPSRIKELWWTRYVPS